MFTRNRTIRITQFLQRTMIRNRPRIYKRYLPCGKTSTLYKENWQRPEVKSSSTRLTRTPLLTQLANENNVIERDGQDEHFLRESIKNVKQSSSLIERKANDYESNNNISASNNSNNNNYVQPSHFAAKFHCSTKRELSELPLLAINKSLLPSAMSELNEMETSLRQSFEYTSTHNTIALRKDNKLYKESCKEFYNVHHRWPTHTEVSPVVNVSVSPVSALKALEYCDPESGDNDNGKSNSNSSSNSRSKRTNSIYKAACESVKLQQAITRNQLAQSNTRLLMRCEKCFHVYAARPRALYHEELKSSWGELEHQMSRQQQVRQLTKNPRCRKSVYSVSRQRQRQQDSPTCCPHCGSTQHQQWMFEYVHQRTHCHLKPPECAQKERKEEPMQEEPSLANVIQ